MKMRRLLTTTAINQEGQAVKEAAEGRRSTAAEGNAVENMTGFSKTKRDLAIKLGVDPYSTNEVFQKECVSS